MQAVRERGIGIAGALPRLVGAVTADGHPVVWSCDPMDGSTMPSVTSYTTRPYERILAEVRGFFAAYRAEGTQAGELARCRRVA